MDELAPQPTRRVRGRPFEKGRSGNPAGRRVGCRNRTTITAAALLAGEAEALTRKAVEPTLVGDPTALRLCIERILPQCAPTTQSPWAEAPRQRHRQPRRHRGRLARRGHGAGDA